MREFVAGADAHINVEFGTAAAPVIPDTGTVNFTVLNHAGTTIVDLIEEMVTTDLTSWATNITVPAANNTIENGRSFERRMVLVNYQVGGRRFDKVVSYRLTPRLHHSVTGQEVRSFLGVNEGELGDADLDLFAAYLKVQTELTAPVLEAALISGTVRELAANTMIRMQAVIAIIPSLKTRIAQSETNGPMGFTRAIIRDFAAVQAVATELYLAARDEVTETDSAAASLTLVLVTQDADPITG